MEDYVKNLVYEKIEVKEEEVKNRIPFYHCLYDFQKEGILFALRNKGRAFIADEMGLGKTIQAIGIIAYYAKKTLVLTTSTLTNQWKNELDKWLSNFTKEIQKDCIASPSSMVTIMSYGLLASKYIDQFLEENSKKFDLIILDESHKLKSRDSKRTHCALKLCKKASHVIGLSGTPMNRPSDLYSQIRCIDYSLFPGPFCPFFRGGSSVVDTKGTTYGTRYCGPKIVFIRGKSIVDYNSSSNLDELHTFLNKTIMIRRQKDQILKELPEKYREYVVIGELKNKTIPEELPQNKFMELIRENSTLKINYVLKYLEDLEEVGMEQESFLIFCHYHAMSDAIKMRFPHFVQIDGRTPIEKRNEIVQEFQSGTIKTLILGIESVSCGVTLTKGSLVLFTELNFNPDAHAQAEDRIHRIGQKNECYIRYLILKGYTDDICMRILQKKTKSSGLVLEGEENKKILFSSKKKKTC